jgi:hypothetical protein
MVFAAVMFFQIMDLCVAVVARCDTIVGVCFLDLFKFAFAVISTGVRESRLQESAAAAAAIVVHSAGGHVHKIFLSHHRPGHVPQVFSHGIAQTLAYQLARVLYGKLYFTVLVPVGIDFQLSFSYPLGVILYDAFTFKVMLDVEPFESDPDCKKFVPSLRIEPDLAF